MFKSSGKAEKWQLALSLSVFHWIGNKQTLCKTLECTWQVTTPLQDAHTQGHFWFPINPYAFVRSQQLHFFLFSFFGIFYHFISLLGSLLWSATLHLAVPEHRWGVLQWEGRLFSLPVLPDTLLKSGKETLSLPFIHARHITRIIHVLHDYGQWFLWPIQHAYVTNYNWGLSASRLINNVWKSDSFICLYLFFFIPVAIQLSFLAFFFAAVNL